MRPRLSDGRGFYCQGKTVEGPNGAIDLPIPTVQAPANTIIITKVTNPASSGTDTFPYTGSLGPFTLGPTTGSPVSQTFINIAPGVTYTVTEGATAGWGLSTLTCAVTAGSDDGTGSFTGNVGTSTATILFGVTDTGVTVTCTYTNIKPDAASSTTGRAFSDSFVGSNPMQ